MRKTNMETIAGRYVSLWDQIFFVTNISEPWAIQAYCGTYMSFVVEAEILALLTF